MKCPGVKIKSKLKIAWTTIANLFIDYSEQSTIHGVSYIGEKGRSWFERAWWFAAFCVSIVCCTKLILDAWNIDPIIISFTEKPTPIWQIPFPAVTICPNIFADYRKLNFSNTIYANCIRHTTRKQKLQLHALSVLFLDNMLYERPAKYPHCNQCLEMLRYIRIPPKDMFIECKFNDRPFNCVSSLQDVALRHALCYTFNGFDVYKHDNMTSAISQEWTIDEGYKSAGVTYPRRIPGAGSKFGLSMLLRMSKRNFEYKFATSPGFWVEYRMPYDTPELESKYLNVQMGTSVDFILKPRMMTTAKELRNYPRNSRQCNFSNKKLKYFKQYTQTNCEIECEVGYIVKYCDCHPLYIENYRKNVTCGLKHVDCVAYYKKNLMKRNFSPCKCLPACTTITYDTEVSVTRLNTTAFSRSKANTLKIYEYTQLRIYFKEQQFMTSERREIYGKTDFLANCGGFLGLFLGISVISLLEIVYFCTIRLLCNLNKKIDDRDQSTIEEEFKREGGNKCMKVWKQLIGDYSDKTTIQGINYVFDTNLSLLERLWWSIVVVMSVICCGSLIFDVVRHYDQSPIIVSYANEETPIYKIPFPAVTICPQIVSSQIPIWYNRLVIQKKSLYRERQPLIEVVTAIAQVCDPEIFSGVDPENRTNCELCRKDLQRLMLEANSLITSCRHITRASKCSEMFRTVMTESGLCFTYNGLDVYRDQVMKYTTHSKPVRWTLDGGYENVTKHWDVFPSAGSKLPLVVSLEVDNNLNDGLCKGPIRGFKVYLHLPNEVPQISKHYYLVLYRQFVQIIVAPKMVITSSELRDFPVIKRHCYFSNERYLRFFRYYTQNNCEEECVANLTLSKCGCMRFYMPKISGVKLCGISDITCYQKAIQDNIEHSIQTNQLSDCNCLPTCTSISYETEVTQISQSNESIRFLFNDEKSLKLYGCTSDDNDYEEDDEYDYNSMSAFDYVREYSISTFDVVFRENQFIAMERSRLYGPTELMAYFGGLLGLFLGFSVMSILEVVYFCTIRLLCNFKMMR